MTEVIKGAVLSVKDKTDKRGRPFVGVTVEGMDNQRYWFRTTKEVAVEQFATLQRYHPITIVGEISSYTEDGQMAFLDYAVIAPTKAGDEQLADLVDQANADVYKMNRDRELAQADQQRQETNDEDAQYGSADIPNGTYTVVFNGDPEDYETVRLKTQKADARFAPGKTIAQFLSGPENEFSYTGFGFVHGSEVQVWRRYQGASEAVQRKIEAVKSILGDREAAAAAGKTYALESGNCFSCGRKLTVPSSIEAGIGPVCATKGGW